MGVTRLIAYTIATRDDIVITAGGPATNGKWAGWVTLGPNDDYRPLLSTEPIYDSAEAAKAEMRSAVAELRRAVYEETGGRHPIDHLLGSGPTAEAVKAVVAGAQAMKAEANERET